MITYNKEGIISSFKLKKSGSKGWMSGDCPLCKESQKLGVIFGITMSSFKCFKCKEHGSLYNLLIRLKREDLILGRITNLDIGIEERSLLSEEILNIDHVEAKDIILPLGFKRIYEEEYLKTRGFNEYQFQKYIIGVTKIHPIYKENYVIIAVEQFGKIKGWIARSRYSKDEIKLINTKRQQRYLRYINSPGGDFDKLLMGYDEIIEGETKEIILVEGFTDKNNIDNLLKLDFQKYTKCCVIFGNQLSVQQIKLLKDKGIESIIILYDPDAVNYAKKDSFEIAKIFHTFVGKLEDKDPGDINYEELNNVLNNLKTPINFKTDVLVKRQL